ncbi:hypothetical protein Pint_00541 [Pistacia integerrima]|uniref:Uncharacterized protein n=1 Tax=Pistacia integerrima TaxID=434235 RepID=A0ACC0ZIG1_9ROSI|nr:hypothetical protein Pint_00541 [Pistacia integerrima]
MGIASVARSRPPLYPKGRSIVQRQHSNSKYRRTITNFQMPLHYPRYTLPDYQTMPEWQLDRLLQQYGLPISQNAQEKRKLAIGTFLWPKW